jgi:class 3 adenylate cyclase
MTRRVETSLIIAFIDLTRFAAQSEQTPDRVLADGLDDFYKLVASSIEADGGRVIKFIGDAALIVFDESDADRAVDALIAFEVVGGGDDDRARMGMPSRREGPFRQRHRRRVRVECA